MVIDSRFWKLDKDDKITFYYSDKKIVYRVRQIKSIVTYDDRYELKIEDDNVIVKKCIYKHALESVSVLENKK